MQSVERRDRAHGGIERNRRKEGGRKDREREEREAGERVTRGDDV
jgi:hypothetical protein